MICTLGGPKSHVGDVTVVADIRRSQELIGRLAARRPLNGHAVRAQESTRSTQRNPDRSRVDRNAQDAPWKTA